VPAGDHLFDASRASLDDEGQSDWASRGVRKTHQ